MSPDDTNAARQVFIKSLTLLDDISYPHEIVRAFRKFYTEDRFSRMLANPDRRTLGAWHNRELVGCLWGYQSPIDGTLSLDWVVVLPKVVARGVFSRLMRAIEKRARKEGALKIIFFVSAKNIPAIKRYLKLGYSIEGVHRHHFFGWDFLSMAKVLRRKRWRGKISGQPDFTEYIGENPG